MKVLATLGALLVAIVVVLVVAEPFASKEAGGQAPTVDGHLYVSSQGSNKVYPFAFDFDGNPSPITCGGMGSYCNSGSHSKGVAMTPDGRYLYVAAFTDNVVTPFSVTGDGSLTPISCSPSDCGGFSSLTGVAVSPAGGVVYVTSQDPNPDRVAPYAIQADGSLKQISCGTGCQTGADPGGTDPYGVAVTPDGRHVYAANSATDSVTPFSVNGDGSLTRMACLPADCGTGSSPRGLAVTPDGRFLYAANHGSDSVSVFSIGSNGALTKVTCTTDCQGPSSGLPVGVAVSPDGRFLYVTNGDPVGSVTNGIVPFSINSDGTLTPIACSDCGTSPEPQGIGVSPDSKFVFASNFAASGLLSAFSIGSTGSLTRIACASPTCDIGNSDEFQSLVVAPQRAPTASFRAGPMPAGQTSNFDGSASRGSGQALARYDWSFGDGGQALDAGSSVTHVYSQAGTYPVTLTVTDDTGCSARVIYTGQTASCSGGPSATQSQSLSVPGVTQPGFSIGSAKLNKKKGTAQLPVTPSQPGSLRLTGSGVAEQSVAASGTVNLLIKPIGKAKKKLGGKGKLSVSVTVTYTPGGGQASSKTATVKLKKVR